MKKRFLSMILAVAMVVSMFAGITLISSAASDLTSGKYVLAADIDGTYYAMPASGIGSSKVAGEVITVINGSVTEADAEGYALNIAVLENGNITISNDEGKYLGYASSTNFNAKEGYEWVPTAREDGSVMYVASGSSSRAITYRTGTTNKFAPYSTSNMGTADYNNVVFLPVLAAGGCNHDGAESTVATPATCTEAGVEVFTCSCGVTWEAAIPATGHNYVEGEVITPATCTTDGEGTVVCTNEGCNDTQTQVIKATGHNFVDGKCTVCFEEEVVLEFAKLNAIVAGDELFIVTETSGKEMVSVGVLGTYGEGAAYAETGMTAAYLLKVEAGAVEGTFAFKAGEQYLAWKTGNSLILSETLDANSSWKISFDEEANVTMLNAADETRQLWWNNQSPRFACYTGKSATASYHTIQFYAIYTGDCRHLNATSEITTPANCTDSGIMTWSCECGETWTTEIPATGHTFTLTVVDGVATMVCECGYSEAVALNTLAEAKAYTDKTTVYNVKGIVTYVNGRTVYIEDANDGLCVYFAADFDTSALNLGDEIFVSSTMTVYNTLPELNAPAAYYVLSTGNTLPENNTVTLADLFADTENAYLGERVTISGLTVGTVNAGGSTMLTDVAGTSIALHKATGVDAIISEGDVITLTAIVSIYKSTYQLIVNPGTMESDITVTSEGGEVVIETVAIADAKVGTAGEYYQVEGVVTAMSADKRTIYIQDATGGIALYLSAKPAEAVCAIGDLVKGYGAFKAYNGLIELDGVNAADTKFFEILSSGNAVEAQLVTIVDLAVDTANEYLSEKIAIEGAVITAIASNGTVTLDQNGTTITIYKAPALAENCTIGATVNVTAVVSSYNGYQLLINEAADVVFVKSCEHATTTVLEGVAATCTTDGLTEGAQCALCGTITVAQEVIPAGCNFVDGVCTVCGAVDPNAAPIEKTITIGHSLNLASDISINFATPTSGVANDSNCYLEYTVPVYEGNEQVGTKTVKVESVLKGTYYYFTVLGITAVNMNDLIEARIYWTENGKDYVSQTDIYSVGTYAYAQLNKTEAKVALKKLCADLLVYGAKAQTYKQYRTDALVDAKMTDVMKSYLSDLDAVTFNENKGNQNDHENIGVSWLGMGIDLNSKVTMKFIFSITDPAVNVEDLSAQITYENYKGETVTTTIDTIDVYNAARGYYSVTFDGLLAAELRSVVRTVIYNGENRVSSTYIYSVDTYGIGRTGDLLALCKALMAYSDSALAFFN